MDRASDRYRAIFAFFFSPGPGRGALAGPWLPLSQHTPPVGNGQGPRGVPKINAGKKQRKIKSENQKIEGRGRKQRGSLLRREIAAPRLASFFGSSPPPMSDTVVVDSQTAHTASEALTVVEGAPPGRQKEGLKKRKCDAGENSQKRQGQPPHRGSASALVKNQSCGRREGGSSVVKGQKKGVSAAFSSALFLPIIFRDKHGERPAVA